MEPTPSALAKPLRLVLNLGKYRVTERHDTEMKLALGGSTTMTVIIPPQADVHAGDILTLYTEVLFKHDKASTEDQAH